MLGNCKFFSCSICSSNAIFTALMLITKLPSRLVLLPKIRSQDQQLIYRVYNLWVVLWAVMLVIPDDISRLCLHDTVSHSLEAPLIWNTNVTSLDATITFIYPHLQKQRVFNPESTVGETRRDFCTALGRCLETFFLKDERKLFRQDYQTWAYSILYEV